MKNKYIYIYSFLMSLLLMVSCEVDNEFQSLLKPGMHTWYLDADGDFYGDPDAASIEALERPEGYVLNNLDLDDSEDRIQDVLPSFKGVFDFEWLVVSNISDRFGNPISVGDKGEITFFSTETKGFFRSSNMLFNFQWGAPGVITFDESTGLVVASGFDNPVWNISNVNGKSLDIAWTYDYTNDFFEYGTVRLTRRDDFGWPANIHTAE